jgi:hypothetical protein
VADFDFPRTPNGTVAELWAAVIRLIPQLGSKVTILRDIDVGTVVTPIAHGLGFTPTEAIPVLKADLRAWTTQQPDSRFIYLQASSATTINVAVFR